MPAFPSSTLYCTVVFLLANASSVSFLLADDTKGKVAEVSVERLSGFDPLSPDEALEAFKIADGFHIELVACEPLVTDPVAFCFDASGRLIVVEMRGYSERADSYTGRVRRLSDIDGDGRMDVGETIVDGLSWPTAVACHRKGYVIGVAPEILFATKNPSGSAFAATTWFTGFGKSNVQGLLNSFRWGIDGKLHGATSSSGGEIRGGTLAPALTLRRRDFSIDTDEMTMTAVPGGAQHGMVIDQWGDKYVTSNSDHLQQVLMCPSRSYRSSRLSDVPPLRRSIAADGPQAEVYRDSPVEPWRIVRTRLRVAGQVPGPVEGGGRAAGYFTGATGTHLYDGDQWAQSESPIALVCDVGSNLVHRKTLEDDGLWNIGNRIDTKSEFLTSRDVWFRPVQLGRGPDGAVYIADMYREVIEHPKSLPAPIKSQLDLNHGNDRGRIWRIVSSEKPVRRKTVDLTLQSPRHWVDLLSHPNAWHRRTAARLLREHLTDHTQDKEVLSAIDVTLTNASIPEARLQALLLLSPVPEALDRRKLDLAISDTHERVRQRALEQLAGNVTGWGPLTDQQAIELSKDESIWVRFQLAYDAQVLMNDWPTRSDALFRIALKDPQDRWIRWAVEGSLTDVDDVFLQQFVASPLIDDSAWLKSLACQVLHHGDVDAVNALIQQLDSSTSNRSRWLAAISSQLSGLAKDNRTMPLLTWAKKSLASDIKSRLTRPATSSGQSLPFHESALSLVQWASPREASDLLRAGISGSHSPAVKNQLIESLLVNDREDLQWLADRLADLSPEVREFALQRFAELKEGQSTMIDAVVTGKISPQLLSKQWRSQLSKVENSALQSKLDSAEVASQKQIDLAAYASAVARPGDVAAGEVVFKRLCASCHSPPPGKSPVGPPLLSVIEKSAQQILVTIHNPNLEVDPKYYQTKILTSDGQLFSGIVTDENDASIELVDSQGTVTRIQRSDIDDSQTLPTSLMPTGLLREMTTTEARDLITFLKRPSRELQP